MLEGLSLGSGVRYVGASYGDKANTIKVDGRTLVDAGVSYKYKDMTFQVNATTCLTRSISPPARMRSAATKAIAARS